MKTEALVARTWDDVVFENRNKDYGAYDIRHEYSKSVITGWGVSVSMACLLVVVPKIAAMFGQEAAFHKPETTIVEGTVVLPPPPIIPDPPAVTPPPPPTPPAQQITAGNVEVTARDVDTQVIDNDDVVTASTSDGEGTTEYTGPAVITAPVEPPPPAIVEPRTFAEVMPKFDGMIDFLSKKLKYPNSARRLGITGKVFVGFVVSADGTITDVKVVRGFHPDCDKEALRVVSMMPAWSPGMQNHVAVPVRMVLPITFQIRE